MTGQEHIHLFKQSIGAFNQGDFNKAVELFAENAVFTDITLDRKSTRLNSSHIQKSRMPSSA